MDTEQGHIALKLIEAILGSPSLDRNFVGAQVVEVAFEMAGILIELDRKKKKETREPRL